MNWRMPLAVSVVVAIDAKKVDDRWLVHLVGGKIPSPIELKEWAREAEIRGAGEILFTSMDHDGTKTDLPMPPWPN